MPLNSLTPYFRFWRRWMAGDREVIDASIAERHVGPSPELHQALKAWPGVFYWSARETGRRLTLIRIRESGQRERWWLHTLLFALTFVTVWMAGAGMTETRAQFPRLLSPDVFGTAGGLRDWLLGSNAGFVFALALMSILLVHELGHYVCARRYVINASPPYFLPGPPMFNFIGTFGAFIRLRSPIVDRRQLFDVGAAGPWAGLLVSMVVLVLGLGQSEVVSAERAASSQQFIYYLGRQISIGDSLLMQGVRQLVIGEGAVLLHPLALAGWCGLFVTMLNLIPLGQLDGGHVVYALIGKHQAKVGLVMWLALLPLGQVFAGWWVWAALIMLLGRGRVAHPSVMDDRAPVPKSRWVVGVATAAVFVLTFTPNPFSFPW